MTKYTMTFTYSNGTTETLIKEFETYMEAMSFKSSYFASHVDIVHAAMEMAH